ncbi:hypothetical protein BB560_006890 [Smittium megazygosporum]|uniref:Uncharacterized protein n=1 Tax=Smittium megazygosporum TaxID=133381 RepID=A0A2T9Y0L1_9FUNG|nr:hypothetical protein BB560_006890 [Smittium megazygosporum]
MKSKSRKNEYVDEVSDEDYLEELSDLEVDEESDSDIQEDSDSENSEEEREAQLELNALLEIQNSKEGSNKKESKSAFEKEAIKVLTKELQPENLDWIETCSLMSTFKLEINDPSDDLELELGIYKQVLEAAKEGKKKVLAAKVKFTRPPDYFAEMVKTDEDMEKIRKRLVEEHQSIEKSEQAKKQRELKKFGKKIQVEKIKERAATKRETLNKIDLLKKRSRSNADMDMSMGDDFDVALGDSSSAKSTFGQGNRRAKQKNQMPNKKRLAKNSKYGFGGKKRGRKVNSADSTADFSGVNGNKKSDESRSSRNTKRPGKKPRLGKSPIFHV